MKKVHSKSTISKKSKTVSLQPESKRNSRINNTNSCIKINLQNTQQLNSNTLALQPSLSKSNIPNYSQKGTVPITHAAYIPNNDSNRIVQIQSQRTSVRKVNAKSSLETIHSKENRDELTCLKQANEYLTKQNLNLRTKCCELQQMSLKDKQKIKNLIIRINQVKNRNQMSCQAKTLNPSTSKLATCQDVGSISYSFLPQKLKIQTPYRAVEQEICSNRDCLQRKKYLQNELYQQRILRDRLQFERGVWEKNRESLKQQYNQLLDEIRMIKQNEL